MEFKVSGILKQVTIKPGKEDEDGKREPPKAIIQVEVPVSRGLGQLNFFVGMDVETTITPYQLSLDEVIGVKAVP